MRQKLYALLLALTLVVPTASAQSPEDPQWCMACFAVIEVEG